MNRLRVTPFKEPGNGAKPKPSYIPEPVAHPPNIANNKNAKKIQNVNVDKCFDEILERGNDDNIFSVVESVFKPIFESVQTILWSFLPNVGTMFSNSFNTSVPAASSLLYYGLKSKLPIAVNNQSQNPNFNLAIDTTVIPANMPVLLIPILARDTNPIGVIQFARKPDNPFQPAEIKVAYDIMKKFKVYSFLFTDISIVGSAFNMLEIESLPKVIIGVTKSLSKHFRCRKAEVWLFRRKKRIYLRFDGSDNEARPMDPNRLGIVSASLNTCSIVNERNVMDHSDYNAQIDGFYPEPVLVIPYVEKTKRIWAIVLRGRGSPPYFSPNDQTKLHALAQFVVHSVSSAVLPVKADEKTQVFQQHLSALLEVAEALSGVLQIEQLIPLIMARSVTLLNAERCSLFLVDNMKQELVTRFHDGLSKSISIPLGHGIAGTVVKTGEVINIEDAYSDNRFDRSIDANTGFKTKSILAVPIYNNRGEIIGVTEMMNKIGNPSFGEDDIRLMMGFNVFCGISLDNAKLYGASLSLAQQVRSFIDMSSAMNQTTAIRNVLTQILTSCQRVINAIRVTLFRLDKTDGSVNPIVSVGQKSSFGSSFSLEAVSEKKSLIYSQSDIAEKLQKENLENAVNKMLGKGSLIPESTSTGSISKPGSASRSNRVSKIFTMDSENDDLGNGSVREALCCIPLFNIEGEVLGVLELSSIQRIMPEDLRLLECFAIFTAVSLERSELKDLATLGEQEMELKEWLSDDERDNNDEIPYKLRLSPEDTAKIWLHSFDAPEWDGMPHIKAIFAIFKRFGFQKAYQITNEKLFRFLCQIRDTYNKVPYHNWRHAIDVTQFVTYQVIHGGLEKVLTPLQLFSLILASICHDANHDGFTNVYNVKAETPLGLLFKNQSVMETHHCEISIGILSKDECNLLASFSPSDFKTVWTTFIQLILATDMSKHFDLLKEFNGYIDSGSFSITNNDHRLLLMKLILKTGDLSNVARPFNLADRWVDVLCEEFFHQGDLEQAKGMEFTSPLNDRAHLDKPKSQVGFYNFVCLPLYIAIAKALPPLESNVNQVKSNLALWKQASDAKAGQAN